MQTPEDPNQGSLLGKWVCCKCKFNTRSAFNYNTHMIWHDDLEKQDTQQCYICNFKVRSAAELRSHNVEVHWDTVEKEESLKKDYYSMADEVAFIVKKMVDSERNSLYAQDNEIDSLTKRIVKRLNGASSLCDEIAPLTQRILENVNGANVIEEEIASIVKRIVQNGTIMYSDISYIAKRIVESDDKSNIQENRPGEAISIKRSITPTNNFASKAKKIAVNGKRPYVRVMRPGEVTSTKQNYTLADEVASIVRKVVESNSTVPETAPAAKRVVLDETTRSILMLSDETVLKCPFCALTFEREIFRTRHIANSHPDQNKLECARCRFKTYFPDQMKVHIQNSHERRFSCNECDYKALSSSMLMRHKDQKHLNKVNQGGVLGPTSPLLSGAPKFIQTDTHQFCLSDTGRISKAPSTNLANCSTGSLLVTSSLFKCPSCVLTFASAVLRNLHLATFHPGLKEQQCVKCRFRTYFPEAMQEHMKKAHERRFSCPHCTHKAFSSNWLKLHIDKNHFNEVAKNKGPSVSRYKGINVSGSAKHLEKDPMLTGLQSDQTFLENTESITIMPCSLPDSSSSTVMIDETLLKCPSCILTFGSSVSRNFHIAKFHPGLKTQKCAKCKFKTYFPLLLQEHVQKTHERRFACPYCDHTELSINLVQLHIAKDHLDKIIKEGANQRKEQNIISDQGVSLLKCPSCHKTFDNVEWQNLHIANFHPHLKTHPCAKCRYKTYIPDQLQEHMQRAHAFRFSCPDCAYTALSVNSLKKHMHNIHLNKQNEGRSKNKNDSVKIIDWTGTQSGQQCDVHFVDDIQIEDNLIKEELPTEAEDPLGLESIIPQDNQFPESNELNSRDGHFKEECDFDMEDPLGFESDLVESDAHNQHGEEIHEANLENISDEHKDGVIKIEYEIDMDDPLGTSSGLAESSPVAHSDNCTVELNIHNALIKDEAYIETKRFDFTECDPLDSIHCANEQNHQGIIKHESLENNEQIIDHQSPDIKEGTDHVTNNGETYHTCNACQFRTLDGTVLHEHIWSAHSSDCL